MKRWDELKGNAKYDRGTLMHCGCKRRNVKMRWKGKEEKRKKKSGRGSICSRGAC
jgi:hypothetical protein